MCRNDGNKRHYGLCGDGNMIGEFPKDDTITIRLHAFEKKKARDIPFSYYEIFRVGLDHLSKEINQLEQKKAELESKIADNKKIVAADEAELTAINNRIRIINPSKLDKDTLNQMINDAALESAKDIFSAHGVKSIERIQHDQAKHSIFATAREWGYDGTVFLELVEEYLKEICNTEV